MSAGAARGTGGVHISHKPPSPAPCIIRICLQSAQMVECLPLLAFLKTMREDHSNPPPFVVNV